MQTAPPPSTGKDSGSKSGTGASKTSSKPGAPVCRRPPEEEPTDYWSYELFGCLTDWQLCCATFLCPCYTLGRNAAYFGDDGALTGLLYCLGLGVGPMLRWRIRQHRHLHGSMLSDVAVHCVCPCCAIIQENRELFGYVGAHVGEQLPLHVEITRQ